MESSKESGIAIVELGSENFKIRARGKFRDKDALDFVPTPESMLLQIDTPNYDGPLDLLLHLIRKHSMDIFDIPIVMITKKYLDAIDELGLLNLDLAGEFLVMAATLAEIKSKMLLPKEEQTENNDDDEADPRSDLVKRLIEYKKYQDASKALLERPMLGRDLFLRPIEEHEEDEADLAQARAEITLEPLAIFELVDSLAKALKKSEHLTLHTITRDRISISARMHELIDFCQLKHRFTFYDALRFFPIYEKIDVIVTFLALLELSRLKLLKIAKAVEEDLLINIVKEQFYNQQSSILDNIHLDPTFDDGEL